MTPREAVERAGWTIEAVREWARDLFATRDEAARVARDEISKLVDSLRREANREVRRLDETIKREVQVRDKRLEEMDRDMQRRLEEERAFRDEVVGQALTREAYEREHRALQGRIDVAIEQIDKRLGTIEQTLANLTGKAVVYAILGSIFLATVTAFVSHLLSG